ncbi:MAG TPA: NAD(P)/FAD-dependent oxidoreductase [Solirubrobacterales bacterium]
METNEGRNEMGEPDMDVLIVGAGISGIGAAVHLQREAPGKSYAILEARGSIGGTWDLFRYPGIRSDSDLHTFCYDFKPWIEDQAIADAPAILRYLAETVAEHGVEKRIRFDHKVRAARWSSAEGLWTVEAVHAGETVRLTARWLFCAGGYYSYDRAHVPELPGLESFRGEVVHPQFWPEDLDYEGRRVVVIGSGATAITLVPALAERAAAVTMLQRTPTYVLSAPAVDPLNALVKRTLGPVRAHRFSRWMNVRLDKIVFAASRRYPRQVRRLIRRLNRKELPDGYDVDTHFNPPYDPWDQRMCLARDGDLFATIAAGKATVLTDRIECLTEAGIRLVSGGTIDADLIVTATGLEMVPFAEIDYEVDGEPVAIGETVTYKGMMLTGVPNFVYALGYTNASWTLKVDLICEHFCRLLALMEERGYDYATPEAPGPGEPTLPLVDLGSGYVRRATDRFPRQGSTPPWQLKMDYLHDRRLLLEGPVGDHLRLRRIAPATVRDEVAA